MDNTNVLCSNAGSGSATQPFCTIGAAASRVTAGQAVEVGGTTYSETVTIAASGTATARIVFRAAAGTTPTLTGKTDGFLVTGSYVTVQGFSVTHTVSQGILVQDASNVLVTGNHVSYSGQPVLNLAAEGIRFVNVSDSVVEQNTVDHNTAYGIYIDQGSTRNLIRANNCFANAYGYQRAASGIRIHRSSQNTISSNWSHDNEDSGMDLDKSRDNLVVDNVFTNNGDHGIDMTGQDLGADGVLGTADDPPPFHTTVTGNTVYKSVTAGINVEGTNTATISNNISVDNGIASPRTHSNIRVDVGSTAGTTVDYDQVYLNTPDMMMIWGNSSFSSLDAFRTATRQETQGIEAAPRWANIAGNDFHLTAGSRAIDSANANAPGQTSVDAEGYARVDDPVTADSGAGVRTFDDRGAYEYHAPVLDRIVVSPANSSVTAGGSVSFTVEGYDAVGNDIGNATPSSSFSISPDGSCAGTSCTATRSGPHIVTATVAGVSATASVSVSPAALDHLAVSPATATIVSRGTVAYTAEGRDQYDNSIGDVTATTTFSIIPDGGPCNGATCGASRAGGHTVTGTNSGKTGTASLQVLAGSSNHILISPASATTTAGSSQAYTAKSFDNAGNLIGDVTSSTKFEISDGSCTANACAATKVGAHSVTALYSSQRATSPATLSVTAGPLDHLALTPAAAPVAAGAAQAYTVQGRDAYDNSLGDRTAATTFTIAPDGSCAGSSCTATLAGSHTVTGSSGSATGTASLQVTAGAAIARIVIAPAAATIAAGATQVYSAQGYDAANNPIGDVTAATSFSIADGSCSGSSCTATSAGEHTVSAHAGSAGDTALLTVTATALDRILVSPGSATIASGGS
ncbi:MAG: nitrous oxide reductase family maturation protein NosD, partial [Gaiellaceae bacterium]